MPVTQTITFSVTPPTIGDTPDTFESRAVGVWNELKNNTVPNMNTAFGQLNALESNVNAKEASAATSATNASNSASEALASATNASNSASEALASENAAAASAASAAALAGAFVGTSITSLTIGTGSKSFTTQANEQYTAGIFMVASSQANPTNYMFGQVTSYNPTTGALVINVATIGGSGTFADWNLSLTGTQGPTGPAGPTFDGGTINNQLITLAGISMTGALLATQVDKGSVGTGTVTFTQSAGEVQKLTVTGALTIATNGWGASGKFSQLLINLVNGGSATLTLPTINWQNPDGSKTTSFSTYLSNIKRPALQTSGVDFMYLWTVDGGTTIYGKLI